MFGIHLETLLLPYLSQVTLRNCTHFDLLKSTILQKGSSNGKDIFTKIHYIYDIETPLRNLW